MGCSAPVPILRLALFLAAITIISPSHAFRHQVDYNGERDEYCYKESFNLGTCLGKAQQDERDLTNAQIIQCMECSGKFDGDETCEELKALNEVEHPWNETDRFSINWHESFCETYNICVETHCPTRCMREQDAWIECLIIELDCDWRCPGSTWLNSRTPGMDENGGTAAGWAYKYFVSGAMLIIGAIAGWIP